MKIESKGSAFAFSSEKTSNKTTKETRSAAQVLSKYHRAAIDGYIDMLCDASKRDTNLANDQNGFTPTLLAAFSGHLEALRMLVGRGGDPEKTTPDGSSALHLAAARNHLNCVSFLVNFGANMWALDNELHTPKDVAAIGQRKEILDFLDQQMAKQSALNTKQVQKLKEKAKVGAEKRLKQMRKAQLKAIKQVERDEKFLIKLSNNRRLLEAAHSIGDIKLVGRTNALLEPQTAISFSPANKSLFGASFSQQEQQLLLSRSNRSHLGTGSISDSSSSSSAYLSGSCAGSSATSNSVIIKNSQPKYSDLVGLRSYGSQVENNESKKQSLKSNSTIGAKLRGVSRKVHLRRMLLSSSSDLRSQSEELQADFGGSGKLCNVQPAIKLKLNSSEANTPSPVHIKWPPAPAMTRALSEPDFFSATVRQKSPVEEFETVNSKEPVCAEQSQQLSAPDKLNNRDEHQQQLLTQCLSQLKMRHEAAILRPRQEEASRQVSKPSIVNSSNELLQHRLNAGRLPLKPSLIKQQVHNKTFCSSEKQQSSNPNKTTVSADSIGSAGSLVQRNSSASSSGHASVSDTSSALSRTDRSSSVGGATSRLAGEETIEMFLARNGLIDLEEVFCKEKIDLEALLLLSEDDLKSLNVLLGPRRKLLKAIEELRLTRSTRPMFVMVDTPL